MQFSFRKQIHDTTSNWKGLISLLLIFFSFFWSLEGVIAQTTITVTKTYTASGTVTITDLLADYPAFDPNSEIFAVANVDILMVGGGGGGGERGGGGGGEVKLINIDLNRNATLAITIGAGGSPNGGGNQGQGDDTEVVLNSGALTATYIALGGGGGGRQNNGGPRNASDGGSGGGGGTGANQERNGAAGGTASGTGGGTSYVSSGGEGIANGSNRAGGGGGGAGGDGGVGSTAGVGGNGGDGISVTGFTGTFGAGGGGSGTSSNGTGGAGHGESGSGGNAGIVGASGVVIVNIVYQILPVEISKFDVEYHPNLRSSNVSWEIAKEWGNSHFEIERAVNSVKNWETIARVEGNGFSDGPVKYEYQDLRLPVAGGNIFYRIKQVDLDGDYTYSETRGIQVEPIAGSTQWSAFPNPTTGYPFNIALLDPSAYRDEQVSLRVFSPIGQSELIQVDGIQGMGAQVSNYFEGKSSGVYTLEISWGTRREYHKVILRR